MIVLSFQPLHMRAWQAEKIQRLPHSTRRPSAEARGFHFTAPGSLAANASYCVGFTRRHLASRDGGCRVDLPRPLLDPWSPGPDFLWLFWELIPGDCTNQLPRCFIRPGGEGFAPREQSAQSGCSLHCAALALVGCPRGLNLEGIR